ncbi:tyrosine-type recombinase/integrase [Burkholderia pseudomallei]|uniref:tyrosine-type recombinase/integrase n=1 Tax=Burkholderia pseudomallei TaxID=28450 RepID=UPI00051005BB|nr:integrase family protein [Burkholderia pseudomallei]KGC58728.1 phage integrase family protein [Burkholderia pseudomallei]
MAKINFTAARVEGHHCPPGQFTKTGKPIDQAFLWDAKTPGLGLRATASGAKTYIFQAKLNGSTVRVTIGDPRSWTIDKAQKAARDLQQMIDDGKDPREVRAEQHAAREARKAETRRQDVTFGEAWDVYVAARKPHWSDRTHQDHLKHGDEGGKEKKRGDGLTMPGPLASLRPLRLPELTSERIAEWLVSQTSERPTMVALSYRMLRAFIRWAAGTPAYRGTVSADAYRSRDIRDAVPRVRAKHGDCLQREQLRAWFDAVRRIGNPVISTYLQALLITGARREELAALRWDDVDFEWRSLSIADKVEDTGRIIPLTPYLRSLLLDLKRINDTPPNVRQLRRLEQRGKKWQPSPWVFASKTASDGKLAEPRIAHESALEVAGLPHVTLHGLRRSFGTLSEWCEVPVGIVAQIQGHKPSAIAEKHYRRRPLDLLRMWHDRIEAWMLEQAGVAFNAADADKGLHAVK